MVAAHQQVAPDTSFVDLLSLCRMEDRWRIVNKTFAIPAGSRQPRNEPVVTLSAA